VVDLATGLRKLAHRTIEGETDVYRAFAILVLMVTALLTADGLHGQAKKDDKKEEAPTIKGVLPPNFGKIGLSEEQKQKIYKIQADARTKLLELQKKLDELKGKEKEDMLSVLTDEQKKKLKEILEGKPDK
jgi:Spy/CpxP family protein refolding chaperone